MLALVLLLTCKGCSHCSLVPREAWIRQNPMASEDEVLITSASFIVRRIASILLMYRQQSESPEPVACVTCAACVGARGPVHI